MSNLEIALLLDEIGDLVELAGDEGFKTRAYRRAARLIQGLDEPVGRLVDEGRLRALPGIGQALEAKITELVRTGTCRYLEDLRQQIPPGLRQVMAVSGVGPRTAILLHRELGVADLEGLEAAARAGRLRELPRLGPRREEAILDGVARVRARGGLIPLAVARPLALGVARVLGEDPAVARVEAVGGVRRWCEVVERVVLLATGPDPGRVGEVFRALGAPRTVELEVVDEREFPLALVRLTGSDGHWRRLQERARGLGLDLDGRGLCRGGQRVEIAGEDDLYRQLGLPAVPPELREDDGEVEAALAGTLPRLVEAGDIRGDLHAHTDWSDGQASLERMAAVARDRGYGYLAVTDHSRSLAMARGLDENRLRQQVEAIAVLNRELAPFRLLTGIEVDILADGSLDLPDSVLAELDVVVASVHSRFRLDRQAMTARFLRAMENPRVDCIGHLTGRLIGERDPYELDLDAVLEACARTGTWLEINASPHRLDVGGQLAREARERGVGLALGTDAHAPVCLEDMAWGVATARRAWLRPEDIVNSRPWQDLVDRRGR
ncbi:MAG: PHP domain-containing protein [bacterium]|nr:PHP domain-containing protein [bacterium]